MIYAMKFFYLCIPFLLFFYPVQIHAQETFLNPIISGSFPDPSICRVGDDFYIVNSSFEYFPGLPIHHSRDLVSWELIGYALNHKNISKSLINLHDVQQEGGIHAPSIRYNDGVFYIITTNVYSPTDTSKDAIMLNFVVTSKDPKGPWSLPHIIEGAPGIDPDIFFDDNGKVWFVGTHALGDKDKKTNKDRALAIFLEKNNELLISIASNKSKSVEMKAQTLEKGKKYHCYLIVSINL